MNYRELPEISEKQETIIDLVFKFRFINRHQLQSYFGYKDPKSVNVLLKDLVEKGYLGRIYSHKLLENTKPAIYFLNNNGIIWIRYNKGLEYGAENEQLDFKHLKKFYEDKKASQTFINHCQNIFAVCLQLKKIEKNSKGNLEYQYQTKTEAWIEKQQYRDPDEDGDFQQIKNCIPDIFLEKIKNLDTPQMTSSTFFIELFDYHVPRYAIRFKVDEYLKFHEEASWKYEYTGMDGKFPIILFIFQKNSQLNSVAKFIKERLDNLYDSEDFIFLLTTYEKVIGEGIGKDNIWKLVKGE